MLISPHHDHRAPDHHPAPERRAKAAAAAEGVTLTSFIEQSLEQRIAGKPAVRREIKLPTFDSGHGFNHSPEELKQMMIETDWGLELVDLKYRNE